MFISTSVLKIDPLIATTFIWYDGYITVATITTTISIFENTTVIDSSTYQDAEAIEKLSKIAEKHPIDTSGTKILDGTEFTDPYGVIYQSPTAITRYDEVEWRQKWTYTPGQTGGQLEKEILTVLPSGFYFTSQEAPDNGLQSWLVSHPPFSAPSFWSDLSACQTPVLIGTGPHAYDEITGPITVHETITAIISNTSPSPSILPAAAPPLPTPRPTPQPYTPDQTSPANSDNPASEGLPKPNQNPAAGLDNKGPENSFSSAPKQPPSLTEHSPVPQSALALLSIFQDTRGVFFVGSQSLLPGSSIVESGTTISLDQTGPTLFLNGVPYKPPSTGSPGMARPSFVPDSDIKDSQPPAAFEVPYIVMESSTYTQNSAFGYEIGSQTLTRGSAITVSGTSLSLDPAGSTIFIKHTPFPIGTLTAPLRSQLVFGDSTYFQNSGSAFEIASRTLTPGGAITVSGTIISLDPKASQVFINNTPFPISTISTSPRPQLVIGGSTYTQNPSSAFVVASQTLRPGGVITVAATTISLDLQASGIVINNSLSSLQAPKTPVQTSSASNARKPVSSTPTPTHSEVPIFKSTSDARGEFGWRNDVWITVGLIFWKLF